MAAGLRQVWNTDYLLDRVPHNKMWLFFLGIAVAGLTTAKQKLLLFCITCFLMLITNFGPLSGLGVTVYALTATGFLIGIGTVAIPRRMAPIINEVASASLFIYMTHFNFAQVLAKAGVPNMWVAAGVAVAGGVVLSRVWDLAWHQGLLFCSGMLGLNRAEVSADTIPPSAVRQNSDQHLSDDPSHPAALLLGCIRLVCVLVAPCRTGASPAN